MQLDELVESIKKVYVGADGLADLSRQLGKQISSGWKSKDIDLLVLIRGATVPARYAMTVLEESGFNINFNYITPTNYDNRNQLLPVPKLRQKLDTEGEQHYKKLLDSGADFLMIDELGDSARSFYLVRIYLTSLISERPYVDLYENYVQPLENIRIGNEEQLLIKLREEVPEYRRVEEQAKIAIVDSKQKFEQQKLIQPDYKVREMGNSWIVYDYEMSKRISPLIKTLSELYHRNNLFKKIIDII